MVLADTYECPDCAYVFDEIKTSKLSSPAERAELKSASLEQECQGCGAMVRVGLVRCWNCNAFMREDVARRYQQINATPQKIIFSDIPAEMRTDYLPPRLTTAHASSQATLDSGSDDKFRLGSSVTTTIAPRGDSEFEIQQSQPAARSVSSAPAQTVDRPTSQTPSSSPVAENTKPAETPAPKSSEKATAAAAAGSDGDDLLSIAMAEQRETGQRRGAAAQTRIMIPCPECQALMPVTQQQAGKKIRCRSCKKVVSVPAFKRPAGQAKKKKPRVEEKEAGPKIRVTWLNDAWLHVFSPTSLVLKPGSLADKYTLVDVAVAESGVFLVSYVSDGGKKGSKPAKPAATEKSDGGMLSFVRSRLLGFMSRGAASATDAANDLKERWKKVREHVARTGEFKDLPNAEVQPIGKETAPQIKLVQPLARVSESMFAGVPVFGEGRIALFLPITGADDKQSYLSLPISKFRVFAEMLKSDLAVELPVTENAIPAVDKTENLLCFYNQTKFEAITQTEFYQKDSDYSLELTGYRCTNCGITVSEEGRKKNKLGGANGKGIAKAKCPKCASKFGSSPLYKIAKAPEAQQEPAV